MVGAIACDGEVSLLPTRTQKIYLTLSHGLSAVTVMGSVLVQGKLKRTVPRDSKLQGLLQVVPLCCH